MQNGQSSSARRLLMISNDRRKADMEQLGRKYGSQIRQLYKEIAGTNGTLDKVRPFLHGKDLIPLGHGPDFGDIWAIVYCLEHAMQGNHVDCFVFLDEEIEKHQDPKRTLVWALLKMNACWYPTLAAASAFLDAIFPIVGVESGS